MLSSRKVFLCWTQYFKVKTKLSSQCQSDRWWCRCIGAELSDAFPYSVQIKASSLLKRMDSTLASSVSLFNFVFHWPCKLWQIKKNRWSLGCKLKAVFDEWNEKLSCITLIFMIRLLHWRQRIIMVPAFQYYKNPSNLFFVLLLSEISCKR